MSSSAPIQWESLPLPVRLVMERLESKGFQVFLVGGCLRDLLRGENPQDYDLPVPFRRRRWNSCFLPIR